MAGELSWSLLPLAVLIALSPIHLIPAVMVVLGPRAGASSAAYVTAWVAGLLLVTTASVVVALVIGLRGGVVLAAGHEWQATAKVVVGALLMLAGLRRWFTRAGHGDPPRWLGSLGAVTPRGAVKLGLLLSLANPKVLLVATAAGATIGSAAAAGGEAVGGLGDGAVALFVVVASATVVLPMLGHLIVGEGFNGRLAKVRDQLLGNHAAAMAVMFTGLGAVVLVEGLLAL